MNENKVTKSAREVHTDPSPHLAGRKVTLAINSIQRLLSICISNKIRRTMSALCERLSSLCGRSQRASGRPLLLRPFSHLLFIPHVKLLTLTLVKASRCIRLSRNTRLKPTCSHSGAVRARLYLRDYGFVGRCSTPSSRCVCRSRCSWRSNPALHTKIGDNCRLGILFRIKTFTTQESLAGYILQLDRFLTLWDGLSPGVVSSKVWKMDYVR
ncbi:hypothetical protein SCP_0102590 [Sparassis crispa]|uniref:Uncharacterized protein n=1 Tax=Sparassis crispa TaxID=139825 RepID=A0A401G5E0_9APHY|nr:hypothetical protein SCP_0102590 [Sparassis crispa]GBE77386.1 hypothetical protein SCP_0102590 [Sparassis crispa]